MPVLTRLWLALLAGAAAAAPPLPSPPVQPIHVSAAAFGAPVEIEVRGIPPEKARGAIQEALAEMAAIERLASPDGDPAGVPTPGGVAALNAAAGHGPQTIDPRLLTALARTLDFCVWSEKAYGPLGRPLHQLWGVHGETPAPSAQKAELLDKAVTAGACERLRLDPQKGTADLAAGSGVDLWGFAEGLAVDRAVEVLRRQGVANGYVQTGGVSRAFGPGPDGRGWSVELPPFPGMTVPLGRVFLHDRALAVVAATDRPLKIGDETVSPWINQRTGQPAQGVLATLTVTDLALDAQGLAVTLTATGPGEGQLRMGSLRPAPSILWLLGTGAGEPLQVTYHWGDVPKR